MATLPSGLPDVVADDEDIARFLTQSNQFNTTMAKPAASGSSCIKRRGVCCCATWIITTKPTPGPGDGSWRRIR